MINFILNREFWFFRPNFPKKDIFVPKQQKVNIIIKFNIFQLGRQFCISFFCTKRVLLVQNITNVHRHSFQHVWISLDFKCYLQQTILIFWTKFVQKVYFLPRTEKVNITIRFSILKLFWLPNFILNWPFWHFWLNLPKKGKESLVYWKYHIPEFFSYYEIRLLKKILSIHLTHWK